MARRTGRYLEVGLSVTWPSCSTDQLTTEMQQVYGWRSGILHTHGKIVIGASGASIPALSVLLARTDRICES